jgi:hypothetical protein
MTSGAARVIVVEPRDDPRWLEFTDVHPDALVYHHPAWLDVLSSVYGHELVALACVDAKGRFEGVLPLFRARRRRGGDRLVSLPHTPSAGPLAHTSEAAGALVREAVVMAATTRGQLQVRSPCPGLDGAVEGLVGTQWQTTYTRPLPDNPDELRFGDSRNHGAVMRAVRKASQHRVEIHVAESHQQLRAWYQLYLVTMRTHTVPPMPFRFFSTIWTRMRPLGLARLLVAERHEGARTSLLAGSLYFNYGRTVLYSFNGRREETLFARPNDAIHWRAMCDAISAGFTRFDMGEVDPPDTGLARYKLKWGTAPGPLFRYFYPEMRKMNPLLTESAARRFIAVPWQRLPLRVTAFLGERLYR